MFLIHFPHVRVRTTVGASRHISCLSFRLNPMLNLSKRAVFKWLSKAITRLQLLRLVIGLKISRQFINQWEGKPKPFTTCAPDFPALRASYMELLRLFLLYVETFCVFCRSQNGATSIFYGPLMMLKAACMHNPSYIDRYVNEMRLHWFSLRFVMLTSAEKKKQIWVCRRLTMKKNKERVKTRSFTR